MTGRKAVETGVIEGIMPLAIAAHDFLEPVENNPPARLAIQNASNEEWGGNFDLCIPGFDFQGFLEVSLKPDETREFEHRALAPEVSKNNRYPLTISPASVTTRERFLYPGPIKTSPVYFAEDLHVNIQKNTRGIFI